MTTSILLVGIIIVIAGILDHMHMQCAIANDIHRLVTQ